MNIFKHYLKVISSYLLPFLLITPGSIALAQQDEAVSDQEPIQQSTDSEQQANLEDLANKPLITLEEITVTGQRSSYLLRAQIEDAKKALYSSYNDMNLDDQFDVNCRRSDWTGTNLRDLVCWPVFFENAVAQNSQDFLFGNAVLEPVGQLQTQMQRKFDELRANIIKVATENPEVEEALTELGTLEAAYEKRQKECREQAPVLFIFYQC